MTFQEVGADRLRVGISGYGLAGRVFHAPFLKGAGFDVAAVVTRNPERMAQVAQDFPEAQICSSIEQMVQMELDLVVVASANLAHVSDALSAIAAGIPVVIDKPLGITEAEVQRIIDASDTNDVGVIPYFNRRWDSDALTIKKVIAEGVIGEVFRLDSRFERYRPGTTPRNWRESKGADQGGGLLLDLHPHLISTALDWFGDAELKYSSVRNIRGMSDDDVVLVLSHSRGVDSYLSASAIIGAPGPRIRLSGTQGTLIIDELDGQEELLRSGRYPNNGIWSEPVRSKAFIHRGDEIVELQGEPGNYGSFYLQVADGIRCGAPWPVQLSDALSVARILDQARASSVR